MSLVHRRLPSHWVSCPFCILRSETVQRSGKSGKIADVNPIIPKNARSSVRLEGAVHRLMASTFSGSVAAPCSLNVCSRYMTSRCIRSHLTGFSSSPTLRRHCSNSSSCSWCLWKSGPLTIVSSRQSDRVFQCYPIKTPSISCGGRG